MVMQTPVRGKDYQAQSAQADAPVPEEIDYEDKFKVQLCRRDYWLLVDHHPDLLDIIERSVVAGHQPTEIKHWAQQIVNEPVVVQRCVNAARFIKAQE